MSFLPETFPTVIIAMAKPNPNEILTDKNSFWPVNLC